MKPKLNILKNELTFKSSTDHLHEVRNFVEINGNKVGLSDKTIAHISLAVDEACTNIIKHAYNNLLDKKIKVKIETSNSQFIVIITDNGKHFDPNKIPEPNIEKNQKMKKGGGLGMFLMKKLMDEVHYNSKVNGNELILIKNYN
ncbi:MAG: ATP-binding protein [Bacteroidetes bacterium]|nr:ATP-binding protein [Bacteroidota bacterium]MBU1114815.1 ATP-binding protein [Bacteroidota bacterium]MBU1797285.1 ATP-binding protein [Bacteroidota bacterium]